MQKTLKDTQVWKDLKEFFREAFAEHQVQTIERPVEDLVADLEARFGNKYDCKQIVLLLKNGFEVAPGRYLFKREDFNSPEFGGIKEGEEVAV